MPEARTSDPQTSHDAAASVDTSRQTHAAVMAVLRQVGPVADFHLIDAYKFFFDLGAVPRQSESGIRTRRKELVTLGLVADTGEKVKLPTGRMATVWGVAA